MDVLFHDAAKPVGDVCAHRLFDGAVGKCGVIVQREDGIPVGDVTAEAPCNLAEVFKAADASALALEIEDVALSRFVAAHEFAGDGDVGIIRAVADGDGVARGLAVAAREAAVDVTCDTTAVEVDGVLCSCTACIAMRESTAVEVSCDVCALQVDAVLGGISCLGADIGTIAVRNGCAAVQDECVLRRVARFLVAVHAVACLKVLGKSGVGCGCDRAARNVERVLFDGVADFAASTPCFGVAAGAVGRMVVPEAVARDVDVLCACGFTVGVEDVFVVAVLLGFPCTGRIVVRKGHVVRAAQKRQDVVARRACRDGVEVLELHLAPVDRGVAPVREGEHGIPVADVVCCVEVDVLEVLDVRRTCIPAVDVQGVACDVRPVAAVDGANGRARSNGIGFCAKVDHVARGRARAAREAAVNVAHAAARDVDGRARGASRGGIVPVDVAHRAARNP